MTHEQELEGYILQGMARAIWGHAFVQWATNVDPPPEFGAGKDWSEVTPPVPPGALKAARDFARGMGELNHLGPTPMTQMFSATRRYARPQRSATRATEADQAFQFGEDVAQACLGTLEVPELGQYKIPEMKAMLDDDGQSLSWDEGWTWHGNPAGENMWAILVDGDRKWEFGRTPDQALEFARQRYGKRWPISLELGEDGRYIRGTRGHTEMPDATAHWSKNPGRWSNSDVQSILFDKARYTTRQAQRWAQDHGFKYGSVDEGHGDFIHLRQFAHRPGQPCATVDLGHGIKARVCSRSNPGTGFRGRVEVVPVGHWSAGLMEARFDDGTIESLPKGKAADFLRQRMPGFYPEGVETHRRFVIDSRIPESVDDVEENSVTIVTPSELAQRGIMGNELKAENRDKILALWQQGETIPPAVAYVMPDSTIYVDDGNHRIQAAARTDRDVAIRFKDGTGYIPQRGARDISDRIRADLPGVRNPSKASLREFAADVNAELPYITPEPGDGAKGRFGDRKVFIAALWRQLRTAPSFKGMTPKQFKDRLVEAHGQRLLVLARADLVAAMDPKEVAESEWVDPSGGRSYHFVVDQSVS